MAKDFYAVGVDLGGTAIKVGLVSMSGRIIKKAEIPSNADKGPDAVIKQIVKGIKVVSKGYGEKVLGIGIGSPGSVNQEKGVVKNPPNLKGWHSVKLSSLVKDKIGKEVYVENDANAAAIGELIFGAGKKLDNFVMVTLGTGVGGGIVLNKEIYRGQYGAAGELGHITIDGNGAKCKCGSVGCIEAYIGNKYLVDRVTAMLKSHTDSKLYIMMKKNKGSITPKMIHEAAKLKDEFSIAVIEDVGKKLGIALASVINLLDVPNVIIGGGVSGFGKMLFDSTEKTIKSRVMKPIRKTIRLFPAVLKNEAGIKGASALVFYKSL